MSPAPPSPSNGAGGFDIATVQLGGGATRTMTRKEYEDLPLSQRISLVLQQQVEFFRGGVKIPPHEAFKIS